MQPWEGRSLWVWHLVDTMGIIKKAKAMNTDTVIVKCHDGQNYWSQFDLFTIQDIKNAGLHVGAWGYCYPNTMEFISHQADCVKKAVECGAEFYVCDAEIEFENIGMATRAQSLMNAIKQASNGKPVGFTSFAFPSYHPDFPWQEFAKCSDFVMPQIYWGDFKRDVYSAFVQSVAEYKKLGKPVVPIGQLYGGVSNSEIAMFLQLSGQSSSWWDYAHLTPDQYSVFTKGGSVMQLGSTGPEVGQLQKDLSLVLKASIKADGDYGPATTAAVKTFQQLYGVRPVDGIVGPVTMAVLKHEVSLRTIVPPKIVVPVQPKVEPKPELPKTVTVDTPSLIQQAASTLADKAIVLEAINLLNKAIELLKEVK